MKRAVLGAALGMALAFGAFGQVWEGRLGSYLGQENFVLIWLNSLGLSQEQLEQLLLLVEELLPLREEIVNMPEKLHEELLSFTGSGTELRELLSSYREELEEKLAELEERFSSGLKNILTVSQWERLRSGLLREAGPIREREMLRLRAAPGRWAPRAIEVYPAQPDFLRGMTLVRLLPTLREVVEAKLQALKG